MRVTSKGQITIPKAIREKLNILPNSEVEFVVEGDQVRLIRKDSEDVFQELRGAATLKMSTDEIMALTRGSENELTG